MSASHIDNRVLPDPFFGASNACVAAIKNLGKKSIVNATLGAVYDEDENLVCLPTVERLFRSLKVPDFAAYAPISGTPDYLATVEQAVFADNRPEANIAVVATPGGSGAIRNSIFCYSERNDAILTHDWFWGPYRTMADNNERRFETFEFFNEAHGFNAVDFDIKVNQLIDKQDSLLIIINSPGHNPVGYSLTDSEWDVVIDSITTAQRRTDKKITLVADIAYIDFAGERNKVRAFMRKFGGLSKKILILIAFSMSKSFTLYGQRCGALVGVSSSAAAIEEFKTINERAARAAWSNCNRGAMQILVDVYKDQTLFANTEFERKQYIDMITARTQLFETEAQICQLEYLPYRAGFFITIPAKNPQAVWQELANDNIFGVALEKGVRLAICGVPVHKIYGVAAKTKSAISKHGG
jgi:aromatic-amino-acid transaminase